jgi:solute carrier family 25 carnitine/acylcarnitine transporter 20/29
MQNQTESVAKGGASTQGRVLYTGSVDCAQQLLRAHGPLAFGRGGVATLYRDTSGMLLYFVVYESMRRQLVSTYSEDNASGVRQVSPVATAVAGGMAGIISWLLVIPLDVIKTRCQAHPPEAGKLTFREATRQILAEPGGVRGFYRGAVPLVLRAGPVNAVTFYVYEQIMSFKNC